MEQWKHSTKRNDKSSSFRQIIFEYLSRSQVQGYSLIVQTDRPLHERILWILITAFGIAITIYLVINSYVTFLESPTVTSELPIKTPILELNFPAVSVCNANRISRKALLKYSKFMWVSKSVSSKTRLIIGFFPLEQSECYTKSKPKYWSVYWRGFWESSDNRPNVHSGVKRRWFKQDGRNSCCDE